jgi:putative glutamine amidotransferase
VLVPTQAATWVGTGASDRPLQAVNRAYVAALQSVGLVPVLLPTLSRLPEDLSFVSGLLLPGGPDVEPGRYGQEPDPSTSPDAESDQMEFSLASWALKTEVPLLAICRGLHVLNVALGGTLHQDLPEHRSQRGVDGRSLPRDQTVHQLRVDPASELGRIVGSETIQVNSLHHQGIDRLAPGLVATAWAPDGLIEGVETRGPAFGLGVQHHPEELAPRDRPSQAIFEAFAAACRGERSQLSAAAPGELLAGSPVESG